MGKERGRGSLVQYPWEVNLFLWMLLVLYILGRRRARTSTLFSNKDTKRALVPRLELGRIILPFPFLGPAVYGFVPSLSRKERRIGCTLLSLHDSGNRQDLNFRVGDDPSRDSTGDQKTQEIITMDRGRKAMPVQNKACMTRHIQKCQERHQQKVKERRKIRPRTYNSDLEYLAIYSSPPSCVI